ALILLQHRVEHVHRLVEQRRLRDGRKRAIDSAAHILLEHHDEQLVLGSSMEEKRPLPDVGALGYFARGSLLEAFGAEEFSRRRDQARALVALVAFRAANDFHDSRGCHHARASLSSDDDPAVIPRASSFINLSIILLNWD